mmetsp:Transcript_112403/g.324720  ORF Transcript_112403/g.324720 Transcript_112403/m.324720 type:complete len:119 (-) Transcript_112403:8-364(-)
MRQRVPSAKRLAHASVPRPFLRGGFVYVRSAWGRNAERRFWPSWAALACERIRARAGLGPARLHSNAVLSKTAVKFSPSKMLLISRGRASERLGALMPGQGAELIRIASVAARPWQPS